MMKVATILSLLVAAQAAFAAEIRTTGERMDDGVATISAQGGRPILTTSSGRAIALEQVKEVRFTEQAPVVRRDAHLYLLAGDELLGTIGDEVKAGDSFELLNPVLGRLVVPLDAVGAIVFDVSREREEKLERTKLAWLLARKGERPRADRFTITGGVERPGRVEHLSREGLAFVDSDKTVWPTFPLSKLEALVLGGPADGRASDGRGTPARASGLRLRVRLRDGSVLVGAVERLEDKKLVLVHALGARGTLTVDVAQVLGFEVLGGAVTYLSDLDPRSVDETFPDGFERDPERYGWKRDREVLGVAPLRLGGRSFAKGLGVHARSSLAFALDGAYRELRATIGLDDSTREAASEITPSVTFRVLVDGVVAKETKKSRGDAPEEIAVPVSGAKEITLVVDTGEWLHILGRADWADAHLVK